MEGVEEGETVIKIYGKEFVYNKQNQNKEYVVPTGFLLECF